MRSVKWPVQIQQLPNRKRWIYLPRDFKIPQHSSNEVVSDFRIDSNRWSILWSEPYREVDLPFYVTMSAEIKAPCLFISGVYCDRGLDTCRRKQDLIHPSPAHITHPPRPGSPTVQIVHNKWTTHTSRQGEGPFTATDCESESETLLAANIVSKVTKRYR